MQALGYVVNNTVDPTTICDVIATSIDDRLQCYHTFDTRVGVATSPVCLPVRVVPPKPYTATYAKPAKEPCFVDLADTTAGFV